MSLNRQLAILYTIAIILLAVLSVTEHFLGVEIQSKQKKNARIINIAGRQRMLSQKLSKAAFGLQIANTASQEEKYLQELQEVVALWSQSHQGLRLGDEEQGLPGANSPEVTLMYAEIEPHYQAMLEAAKQILSNDSLDSRSLAIQKIIQHEENFLTGMDKIVFQYDEEATEQVDRTEQISMVLLGIILLVIFSVLLPAKMLSTQIKALINQMQESGIQVTSSTTDIAASARQLEAMLAEQVASTNEVVATAKEIAANSEELSHTMDEVAAMADRTANAGTNSQQNLQRMGKTMGQLAQATTSISAKLGAISEKANNINTVVTTITQVADRTNLLSLNAAIEAEKSGEYGAGFAVVAREIRRLADRTAVATLDIEQMVKEMQGAVSSGVMEMDKFSKQVRLIVRYVRKISHQLGEIIEQVQHLTPRFQLVSQGMENQTQAADQITEAMIQLSEAGSQIAESLSETNRGIQQLNEAAQGLQGEISRFQIKS